MRTILKYTAFAIIVALAYANAGRADLADQQRAETERAWHKPLPSPEVSEAVNAAYMRGRIEGATEALLLAPRQAKQCGWRDLFPEGGQQPQEPARIWM